MDLLDRSFGANEVAETTEYRMWMLKGSKMDIILKKKGNMYMTEYEAVFSMLQGLGYLGFTKLQEKAFYDKRLFQSDKNIMITGSTSSGKTLIPVLYYLYLCKNYDSVAPMLYAVPYKALALQKMEEIKGYCEKLQFDIEVQISSGDYKENDGDILNSVAGNRIVIIIYEKIFVFSSIERNFFRRYPFLVLDEFGIVDSRERGVKADFILLKSWRENVKIFLLTTPYFDWNLYIEQFRFVQIKEEGRPVDLVEIPIVRYNNRKGIRVEADNIFINSRQSINSITIIEIVAELCEYCIDNGMTVMVFKNNRTEIVKMAGDLYRILAKKGKMISFTDREVDLFKEELLKDIYCLEEDLEGIFQEGEQENCIYQALMNGIAIHSAALPLEFREYIEHNWGKENSKYKIVFSTETLAYGINSNVDMVIVADMIKQDSGGAHFLNYNEYHNYIGRAGRLGKKKGYAVTIINCERYKDWIAMRTTSQIVQSQFFSLSEGQKTFYLLSLFNKEEYVKYSDILRWLEMLPTAEKKHNADEINVNEMLKQLQEYNLITIAGESQLEGEPCYKAKEIGAAFRGYVVSIKTYQNIVQAVRDFCKGNVNKPLKFLFRMCGSEDFLQNSIQTCGVLSDRKKGEIKQRFINFLEKYREKLVISKEQINSYTQMGKERADQMRFTMGMYLWSDGKSMHEIYSMTELPYGLLKKLGENMSYYMEMAYTLSMHVSDNNDCVNYLKYLQMSVYYGIPIEALKALGLETINPKERYQYRSIGRFLQWYENRSKKENVYEEKLQGFKLLYHDSKLISQEKREWLESYLGEELFHGNK